MSSSSSRAPCETARTSSSVRAYRELLVRDAVAVLSDLTRVLVILSRDLQIKLGQFSACQLEDHAIERENLHSAIPVYRTRTRQDTRASRKALI